MLRSLSNTSRISRSNSNLNPFSLNKVRFNSTTPASVGLASTPPLAPVASTPVANLGKQANVAAYPQNSYNGGNGNGGGRKKAGFFKQLKRVTYTTLLVGAGTFAYCEFFPYLFMSDNGSCPIVSEF